MFILTMMNKNKQPLIIVFGGTYGVGKTTLAHQLGIDLRIMTRVGLSGITQAIKTILPNNLAVKNWNKYDHTNIGYVRNKLKKEAKLVGKVVHNIAFSAERTGENYIIDGSQLLPEFLPMDKILFFYIFVSNSAKHKMQFSQPTITRLRHKNNPSYSLAKKVGKIILEESKDYPIYHINNIRTPQKVSKQIIKIIKKDYPDYRDRYLWFGK